MFCSGTIGFSIVSSFVQKSGINRKCYFQIDILLLIQSKSTKTISKTHAVIGGVVVAAGVDCDAGGN